MHSFLLNQRLYCLSRTLVRHKFSITNSEPTRDDISQAHLLLYSDMLQYYEEHPDYGYLEIYHHFVDGDTQEILNQRHRRKILLAIAVGCIAVTVIGYFVVNWLVAYILKNVPISYIRV